MPPPRRSATLPLGRQPDGGRDHGTARGRPAVALRLGGPGVPVPPPGPGGAGLPRPGPAGRGGPAARWRAGPAGPHPPARRPGRRHRRRPGRRHGRVLDRPALGAQPARLPARPPGRPGPAAPGRVHPAGGRRPGPARRPLHRRGPGRAPRPGRHARPALPDLRPLDRGGRDRLGGGPRAARLRRRRQLAPRPPPRRPGRHRPRPGRGGRPWGRLGAAADRPAIPPVGAYRSSAEGRLHAVAGRWKSRSGSRSGGSQLGPVPVAAGPAAPSSALACSR